MSEDIPAYGEHESKESEPTSEDVARALVRIGRRYNLDVDQATIEVTDILGLPNVYQ